MYFYIVEISAAKPLAQIHTLEQIFQDSNTQIGRNTRNFTFNVGFQLLLRCQNVADIGQRFKVTLN